MSRPLERWGGWRLGKENYTLEYQDNDPFLDLDHIQNANDILRQVFEINQQAWASPQAVKELLCALEYLLDPQADYRLKAELRQQYEASKGA